MGKRICQTGNLHSSVRGRHGELLSTSWTLAYPHGLYRPKHIEKTGRGRDGAAIGRTSQGPFFGQPAFSIGDFQLLPTECGRLVPKT